MTKKKNKPIDEMEKLQQAIFEREVDEELQRERLRNLWQKYRFAVIGLVIGILLTTIGTEVYHSWRQKVSLSESDSFENAAVLAYTGETDKAVEILKKLASDGRTGYAPLAEMKLAGIYFSQNKPQEGIASLNKVIASDAPEQLKAVATIAYVGQQFETEDPAKLQTMLKPLLAGTSNFVGSAAELSAALYLKQNNQAEAINVLTQTINNPKTAPAVKQRLSELLSVIKE
ncbi:MAG: tetratricopeptide repeat protein [Alphaproteobacteria bacterium]|nr:tetratricopeptide repeat protein [Alphaproteobacteria bacterium]